MSSTLAGLGASAEPFRLRPGLSPSPVTCNKSSLAKHFLPYVACSRPRSQALISDPVMWEMLTHKLLTGPTLAC